MCAASPAPLPTLNGRPSYYARKLGDDPKPAVVKGRLAATDRRLFFAALLFWPLARAAHPPAILRSEDAVASRAPRVEDASHRGRLASRMPRIEDAVTSRMPSRQVRPWRTPY